MTITTLSTSVQQCINSFVATLIRNKTLILQCIGFTFLWGLIAHGYMFANNNLSWDSLSQFVESTYAFSHKVPRGRIWVPLYHYVVRGFATIPWMIGIISLLYIGLAAFLIAKIFSLRSITSLILLTGILCVNITVIALTATYISDLDTDMFAMLAAVVSVFCWAKYKRGFLLGAIPLAVSLGIYQSYISTTITLIIFVLILNLLQGQHYREVLLNSLKAIAMILCAGLLYFCSMKVIFAVYDITLLSGDKNSLDAGLTMSWTTMIEVILQTYTDTIHKIFYVPSVYKFGITKRVHILLIAISVLIIVQQIFSKRISIGNKIFIIVLLTILPWAMNICQILAANFSHDLMYYAFWLIYLFVILIVKWNGDNAILAKWNFVYWSKILTTFLLTCILLWNVRLANTAYFIKDLESEAALSLFTKISADIEHRTDYIMGETKIAFIGVPTHMVNKVLPDDKAHYLVGMWWPFSFFDQQFPEFFNKYILQNTAKFVSREANNALSHTNEVQAMPLYPAEGSIEMIGDILVVKLGETVVQP